MKEPLKAGDMAEIIDAAFGKDSPNVGKIVRVSEFRGEHSQHGRIWRVEGDALITEYGAFGTHVDCAQSWLKKIDPDTLKTNEQQHKEITA